mgnify:CR=1 FL=1
MSTKEQYWKYSLITIIIGLGIILARQITPFLGGLLGALTIYILVRRQMIYLSEKRKIKRSIAATVITAEAILCFLVPLALVVWLAVVNLQNINLDPQAVIAPFEEAASIIKARTGYNVLSGNSLSFFISSLPRIGQTLMGGISSFIVNMFVLVFVLYFMLIGGKKMEQYVNELLPFNETNTQGYNVLSGNSLSFFISSLPRIGQTLMGGISSFIVNMFVLVFVLYFMLIGGKKMEQYVNELLPFNETNTQEIVHEINMIVRSNAIGIPLLAVIQGGVAMLGYWIFDAPNILFSGFLTGFASIIPMAGTALVWIPIAIYMALIGNWFQAIGLVIFGSLVISQLDNLIRFVIQKKMADIHPLITVFGVVIGLSLFGFMGVIFGPLLLSLFFLFVNMFKKGYLDGAK